jgi:protein TonB
VHRARPVLGPALAISLALHAALIFVNVQEAADRTPKPPPPDITVRLPAPPKLEVPKPEPVPRLQLPPEPERNAIATPPKPALKPRPTIAETRVAPPDSPQRLSGQAARVALEQLARDLPYPAEAIERGLQGEALVLIFLDAAGNAIAARLETSSGHAILDEAAVRAARQLRALPDSAPREALLPVRFRLR